MTARIEHTPDGTLVHDTARGDTVVIAALKGQGFKWSRNLGAWYLPRTWTPATREQRVRALEATLGDAVTVTRVDGPRRSAAERETETIERAAVRAERMDARAERLEAESAAAESARRRIQDLIPLGQPILVGHHSERRHRNDIARMDRNMRREIDTSRDADTARAAADRARIVATGTESTVTRGNRIERNQATLRSLERQGRGDSPLAVELRDAIAHDESKGPVDTYSRDTVRPGDLVRIRGRWYPVVRSNVKTVSVPWTMGGSDSTHTDTAPWREVQSHRARSTVTATEVHAMAATVAAPFPGLAARLDAIAATLADEGTS